MAEIAKLAHAGDVLFQIIHRQRALQRQVVQLVIKADRHIAACGGHGQLFVPLARPMHHGEAVGAKAVDHAVIHELARIVEHAGVNRLARHQLFHVARGGAFDHMAGRSAGDMHLFQARHIHQPCLGADRHVFGFRIARIRPSGPHARPIFKIGSQGAVTVAQSRESPRIRHSSPRRFRFGRSL